MPKISYLIALYNKELYIEDCLDSIIDDKSEVYDLEICIVDDGSTDKSLEIISKKYSRLDFVKIHKFSVNQGKVAAYNQAFSMCTGDYISIFGADDTLIRGRTLSLFEACRDSGCVVYGGFLKHKHGTDPNDGVPYLPPENPNYYANLLGNALSGGCFMAPIDIMKNIFPIPLSLTFEDWWISNSALKANKVKTIPNFVTNYRIHGENDCGALSTSLASVKKDYERHFHYLFDIRSQSNDRIERLYVERAINIRRLVCGQKIKYVELIKPPFDKSYIMMWVFFLFGGRVLDLKSKLIK